MLETFPSGPFSEVPSDLIDSASVENGTVTFPGELKPTLVCNGGRLLKCGAGPAVSFASSAVSCARDPNKPFSTACLIDLPSACVDVGSCVAESCTVDRAPQ